MSYARSPRDVCSTTIGIRTMTALRYSISFPRSIRATRARVGLLFGRRSNEFRFVHEKIESPFFHDRQAERFVAAVVTQPVFDLPEIAAGTRSFPDFGVDLRVGHFDLLFPADRFENERELRAARGIGAEVFRHLVPVDPRLLD